VKENGKPANERKYLVLPLAHQNRRHVPRRVLHGLLHLINKGERAREITREQEKIETCLDRRLFLPYLQNHHDHLKHLCGSGSASQRAGRLSHGPKAIFCWCLIFLLDGSASAITEGVRCGRAGPKNFVIWTHPLTHVSYKKEDLPSLSS